MAPKAEDVAQERVRRADTQRPSRLSAQPVRSNLAYASDNTPVPTRPGYVDGTPATNSRHPIPAFAQQQQHQRYRSGGYGMATDTSRGDSTFPAHYRGQFQTDQGQGTYQGSSLNIENMSRFGLGDSNSTPAGKRRTGAQMGGCVDHGNVGGVDSTKSTMIPEISSRPNNMPHSLAGQKRGRNDDGEGNYTASADPNKRQRLQSQEATAAEKISRGQLVLKGSVPQNGKGFVDTFQVGRQVLYESASVTIEDVKAAALVQPHSTLRSARWAQLGLELLTGNEPAAGADDQHFWYSLTGPELESLGNSLQIAGSHVFGRQFMEGFQSRSWESRTMADNFVQAGQLLWCPFLERIGDVRIGVEDKNRVFTRCGAYLEKIRICLVLEIDEHEARVLKGTSFAGSGVPTRYESQWFRLANDEAHEVQSLPAAPAGTAVVRFDKAHSASPLSKPTMMRYTAPERIDSKTPYTMAGILSKDGFKQVTKLMELKEHHPLNQAMRQRYGDK